MSVVKMSVSKSSTSIDFWLTDNLSDRKSPSVWVKISVSQTLTPKNFSRRKILASEIVRWYRLECSYKLWAYEKFLPMRSILMDSRLQLQISTVNCKSCSELNLYVLTYIKS